MTPLDMVTLYETLMRENGNKYYRISRQGKWMQKHKDTFKRLKMVLDEKDIPVESFMRVQFMNKGHRPFPNQMAGDAAFNRWELHKKTENVREMHEIQKRYLKQYIEQDYTLEEALAMPQFYYYFRCMVLKDHPTIWKFYAKKELDKMPELKKIAKGIL